MADEIQRLILEVLNADRVKELNRLLADEQEAIRGLHAQLTAGAITQQQYEQSTATAARAIAAMRKEMGELQKATGGFSSQGALQLQYVLDDLVNTSGGLDRKLAAISNNIPGLLASLGMGGIAGAVGIISTALIALTPLAVKAWEALSGGEGAHRTLDVLEEVADKTKAVKSELEKLLKAQGGPEKQTQQLVEEFLAGRGEPTLGAIAKALAATRPAEFMTDDERRAVESVQHARPDVKAGVLARVDEQVNRRAMERAGQLLGELPTRRAARDTVRALATAAPGAFPKGFAGQLAELEPEAVAAQDADLAAAEEEGQAAIDRARERRRKEERERRELDAEIRADEERDADNLREFRAGKAKRARANREAEAEGHRRARAAEEGLAEGRHTGLANDAVRASQRAGAGTPTAEQASELADQALRNMQAGMDRQAAVWGAVVAKIQAMGAAAMRGQQVQQQMQAQMGQLNVGVDQSGQFTPFPPMW